jgi:hypothetical protein
MEVGRVGDLRIRDGSMVRLPLVGDRRYRWRRTKNLSKKERLEAKLGLPLVGSRLYE